MQHFVILYSINICFSNRGEPSQISKMKIFAKIEQCFQSLTISTKTSILFIYLFIYLVSFLFTYLPSTDILKC